MEDLVAASYKNHEQYINTRKKFIHKNIDDGVTFDLILYLFLLIFLFSSFLSGWSATTEVEGIAFNFKRFRFQFDIHRRALKYF